jgi:hypothetical protein
MHRDTDTTGLLLVFFPQILDGPLDIGKGVEGLVGNVVLDAVFLESETTTRKEDVGFARGGEVGHAISHEDDQRDLVLAKFGLGEGPRLVDGKRLVMTQLGVVAPDGLPFRSVGIDRGIVGDDLDPR